jgi:hypothetical protein
MSLPQLFASARFFGFFLAVASHGLGMNDDLLT